MIEINKLRKRLARVNTALNYIEDGWPQRKRLHDDGRKARPLKFKCDPPRIAAKHVAAIKKEALRLARGLPTWEVTVEVYAFTGQQAGCVINVFVNGSSPGRCGCQVYNFDLKSTSTSYVPALQACVAQWPAEVDRLLKRFESYPAEVFESKRYAALCELRRRLNQQWHSIPETHAAPVPGPLAYPYGKHPPGWPTF